MGKKILYGIEDYVKDKQAQDGKAPAGYEAAIRAATPSRVTATPQGGAGYGIRGGSVYIKPASEQQRKFLTGAVKAPEAEAETPSDGLSADTPMTQRELMYQNVVNAINSASQNLLDVMNRKFQYDEKSSPLYSILQKQYEREAEKAAGQAYAASVANTGGYGSSYATMAGEAARRKVMAGFDDQQLALYEAAKQEFDAERQSALDWYNTAVGMKEQAAQLVDEEKAETGVAESGMTQSASEAAQYLLNTYGVAYSEQAMRQDLLGKGYSEADVNAALESQRKMASGAVTDYKAGDITSAVAQAETLDEAYRQGRLTVEEYDEAKTQNSKVIMDSVYKGMERIEDTDYAALGISDEEWEQMDDADKKTAVFDRIGQMAEQGIITRTDYYHFVYDDISEKFNSDDYQDSKNKERDAIGVAAKLKEYRDSGYLAEDDFKRILYELVAPQLNVNGGLDRLKKELNERKPGKYKNFGEAMDDARAFKRAKTGVPNRYADLLIAIARNQWE